MTVTNSTVSNNTYGRGIVGGRMASIGNSIIAGNTSSSGDSPDLSGPLTSRGRNLVGVSGGTDGFANGTNGDIVGTPSAPVNPRLLPLADYGGPTASSDDASKRAQVLLAIAEDPRLMKLGFTNAFLVMHYFGYLRRDPYAAPDSDYTGYHYWLRKLVGYDFIEAEMTKAFINSDEYRKRFGP